MRLLEYKSGSFVNGEIIDWIELKQNEIKFTVLNDQESMYEVEKDFQKSFVNHLQALNDNINNIEASYNAINKD